MFLFGLLPRSFFFFFFLGPLQPLNIPFDATFPKVISFAGFPQLKLFGLKEPLRGAPVKLHVQLPGKPRLVVSNLELVFMEPLRPDQLPKSPYGV